MPTNENPFFDIVLSCLAGLFLAWVFVGAELVILFLVTMPLPLYMSLVACNRLWERRD